MTEFPDCKITETAEEYRGIVAETLLGEPCDVWEPDDLPDETRDVEHNRCRNPDSKPEGPWCYYNNRADWDYCDVRYCKGEYTAQIKKVKQFSFCQI